MQKSAISQKLPPQILFILHQNTCFGPYFNMKYWFFREPTKNFSRRLILWISTQDGQNRHVDPMMVQKGPNGPETLLTCIIHNYRSYWPALGPFRYPRGAKRAISAQSLKLLGPNFSCQKKSSEYRHVGCPESCNGMPCSYIAVAGHIEPSSWRKKPKTNIFT